jgi:hypothetical protein
LRTPIKGTRIVRTGPPDPQQQPDPTQRRGLGADLLQDLVHIGQGHHEGDRFAIIFGNLHQIGFHQRLQLLARIGHFAVGDGNKTPIVAPRIVEDVEDDRGFLVKFLEVDAANVDARVLLARFDDALDERREFLVMSSS